METNCKAIEEMWNQAKEEGREEGLKEGIEEGMNLCATLVRKLLELGREEDIQRAAVDVNFRNQLFAEFSLK